MFAKVFNQIFDSSIVEDPELRFTFMDLLVLADAGGVVDMTHEAIARRTNRPLEIIRKTILTLESPDERSRTPDESGRRLKRIDEHRDWGWLIINYERFRKTASEEQRREKTAARVAKYKAKLQQNCLANAPLTLANAANAMQRQRQKQKEKEGEGAIAPAFKPLPEEAEAWNSKASLRKVAVMSPGRSTALRARRTDAYFAANWRAALDRIAKSDFCAGKNDRGWRADFDFFLRPDTVAKVMEGKYDNRGQPQPSGLPPRRIVNGNY